MKPKTELFMYLALVLGFSALVLIVNGWDAWSDTKIWLIWSGGVAVIGVTVHFITKYKELKRKR